MSICRLLRPHSKRTIADIGVVEGWIAWWTDVEESKQQKPPRNLKETRGRGRIGCIIKFSDGNKSSDNLL